MGGGLDWIKGDVVGANDGTYRHDNVKSLVSAEIWNSICILMAKWKWKEIGYSVTVSLPVVVVVLALVVVSRTTVVLV